MEPTPTKRRIPTTETTSVSSLVLCKLERELASCKNSHALLCNAVMGDGFGTSNWKDPVKIAKANRDKLEALKRDFAVAMEYSHHLPTCQVPIKNCDCGLDELLSRLKSTGIKPSV